MGFLIGAIAAAALAAGVQGPGGGGGATEAHVKAAEAFAGADLRTPLFLCRADSGQVVRDYLQIGSKLWLEPTWVFDNLAYVGNGFVGVFVLRTSAGLILFDSTTSPEEAEHRLVPGLAKLGLKPADIRYVIVTHGHWDHFGGAAWLQKTYGARVGLSQADWTMIERTPRQAMEINGRPIPRRDLVIADGQKLTLGDTTITFYVTPGHTPGTVSAIVPARQGGRTYVMSLLGSTAFPPGLEPTDRYGGVRLYDQSVRRFARISREAGAVGLLNTHMFGDGGLDRLDALQTAAPGAANPFVIGADAVNRYYGLLDECLQAAALRLQSAKPDSPAR
jgi:metallo-beta-lactamase class B